MKRFMLITVIEREIKTERYATYEEAYDKMKNAFESFGGNKEMIEDEMAELGEWSAWITDGNNHDDYDWEIIDLQAE